jgi:hypothetical protein
MKWRESHIKDGEKKIINLIHVVKKNLWCQGVPGLTGFALGFFENICWENNLELF